MKRSNIPNKWFYIPIILLAINFIFRLINQSKLLKIFPLGQTNDYSGHMAMLYFLDKCGFHNICQYWYNGYILFKSYTPSWTFFAYPLYKLTNNILTSTYFSLILIFILAFIIIYFFGEIHKLSKTKRIAFFLFLFANAMSIGNFIRLGRLTEIFAWVIFLLLAFLILWYKDHKITKNRLIFFIIIYSILMISHPLIIILSHILLLSLIIIKNYKERIYLIISIIIGLIISSFWWLPYIIDLLKNSILTYGLSNRLLVFKGLWLPTNLATFIVVFIFWITFYFYLKSQKEQKKELMFFIPPLILSLLFVTRIVTIIPVLKHIYPDSYMFFFLFLSIFYFLKSNLYTFPKIIKKILPYSLIIIVLISITVNILYTPYFNKYTKLEYDTLSVLESVEGSFLILNSPSSSSYCKAYYSYAPIYFNYTTPSGWSHSENSLEYLQELKNTEIYLKEKNCNKLIKNLEYLNTTDIITYNEDCKFLQSCNLKKITEKNNVCLYQL